MGHLTGLLALVAGLALVFGLSCAPTASGIRVQLRRPAAQHSDEDIKQLLKCARLSSYSNQTAPELGLDNRTARDKDSEARSCSVDLLRNAFSPYIGLIKLGNPPQEFEMLFDTGSDLLWVAHEKCRMNERLLSDSSGGLRGYRNLFSPEASQTCKRRPEIGESSIKYLNGLEFKGEYACDQLSLGRGGRQTMAFSQCFSAVTQINNLVETDYEPTFDGIVGLSWPDNSDKFSTSLMENLVKNGLINEPVFAVYLNQPEVRTADHRQAHSVDGELTFGSINRSLYKGDIIWVPVTRTPHWQIRIERIEVVDGSDATLATACEFGCDAVVDTGTSYVVGPKAQVDAVNTQLGFIPFPTNQGVAWCPDFLQESDRRGVRLVFHIHGHRMVLSPSAFGIKLAGQQAKVCTSIMRSVEFKDTQISYWLLGASFIEHFYTIFDYGQRRIGFALKAAA